MDETQTLYLASGLVVSLLFSEIFGLAPGGIIVPGYLAMYIGQPWAIAITLVVAYVTYFIVYVLSTVTIIYGRRRTVMMLLTGFLVGWLVRAGVEVELAQAAAYDAAVIGYIIPGLIAIWIDRQGVIETFASSITASVVTRLCMILATGL